MSKPRLSVMDHKRTEGDDVQYLVQPRGPGKSWVFRMVTPPTLVGVPNPWDGKPLRREIKRGLATSHLPEARKRRDVLLGDVRRLEAGLGDEGSFSLTAAFAWRNALAADHATPEGVQHGGIEMVLHDKLEAAEARGVPLDQLRRFSRIATGKGYPLDRALSEYVEARRVGNPFGFKPLKRSTVMNLETAAKHLRAFLRDDAKTACLEDVKTYDARRLRDEYLPAVSSPRNLEGMSAETVAKNVNLLRQLWVWAVEAGKTPKRYSNPWVFPSGIRRSSKREQVRQD